MHKTVITLLVVIGLALILVAVSLWVYPEWLDIPGGWLALLGAAFLAIAGIGGNLKSWREFLFPSEDRLALAPPPEKIVRKTKTALSSPDTNLKPASINIKRNWVVGRNKMSIRREATNVEDNKIVGENVIEVGAKPGPKPRRGKKQR